MCFDGADHHIFILNQTGTGSSRGDLCRCLETNTVAYLSRYCSLLEVQVCIR